MQLGIVTGGYYPYRTPVSVRKCALGNASAALRFPRIPLRPLRLQGNLGIALTLSAERNLPGASAARSGAAVPPPTDRTNFVLSL
jgi:hypothetical protein